MAQFTAEFVLFDPDDADDLTATDVAMLRPPSAVWGYHMQATDQALSVIARTITVRDVEIATLRRQLFEAQSAADFAARQAPSPPWAPSPPLPPPPPWAPSAVAEAEAAGALGAAAASPPLTSRPSVWRREVADQQPAAEHPAAGGRRLTRGQRRIPGPPGNGRPLRPPDSRRMPGRSRAPRGMPVPGPSRAPRGMPLPGPSWTTRGMPVPGRSQVPRGMPVPPGKSVPPGTPALPRTQLPTRLRRRITACRGTADDRGWRWRRSRPRRSPPVSLVPRQR